MRITNIYRDETAASLIELGYIPAFLEDIKGGEDITLLHTEYHERQLIDIVEFLKVIKGTVRKYPNSTGGGCWVCFVGMTDSGVTKPISHGGTWGIYIRKGDMKPGKKIQKGFEFRKKAHGDTKNGGRKAPGSRNLKKTGTGKKRGR